MIDEILWDSEYKYHVWIVTYRNVPCLLSSARGLYKKIRLCHGIIDEILRDVVSQNANIRYEWFLNYVLRVSPNAEEGAMQKSSSIFSQNWIKFVRYYDLECKYQIWMFF